MIMQLTSENYWSNPHVGLGNYFVDVSVRLKLVNIVHNMLGYNRPCSQNCLSIILDGPHT